jgi:hypothetical protein
LFGNALAKNIFPLKNTKKYRQKLRKTKPFFEENIFDFVQRVKAK